MAEDKQKLNVIDNPSLHPVYVDTFIQAAFDGGAMTITLGTSRFVPPTTNHAPIGEHPAVYIAARIAISQGATIELANALNTLLAQMGVKRTGPTAPESSQTH